MGPAFSSTAPPPSELYTLSLHDALPIYFPLLGGRIDVIGRQPVPVLVYGHGKHIISLTAMPAPGKPDATPAARAREGYHLLAWTADGTTYWAVSDVAAGDLARAGGGRSV